MPMLEHKLEMVLRERLGSDCEVDAEGVGQELSPVSVRVKHKDHPDIVVKSTMSFDELVDAVVKAHDESHKADKPARKVEVE